MSALEAGKDETSTMGIVGSSQSLLATHLGARTIATV